MAGNSHKHTRLVNYGRRRSSRAPTFRFWYIIPIALCLAFACALILGNVLGEIATPSPESESNHIPTESLPPMPTQGGKVLKATFVSLKGISFNTASEVARQIPDGATSVSMELFDASGNPYYDSAVATSFGKPSGELTLKNTFKPISEGGLYSSVLFPSSLLSVTDQNKHASVCGYEATLANELRLAGANEIVVYFNPVGSDLSSGNGLFDLTDDYISSMRLWANGLRVGITLTAADLKSYAGSAELEGLCSRADFCAVDLTGFTTADSLSDTLLSHASTVLRHEMRLIISENGKSDEFIATQTELLQKLGVKNIQYADPIN